MHKAAANNDVAEMKSLKVQGADINAKDRVDGHTPMHHAAGSDAVEAMIWLKSEGADINARNGWNTVPIHCAAKENALNAMKWLKTQGADIDADRYQQLGSNSLCITLQFY